MNTAGLGFNSVVLFERPIYIKEYYSLFGIFLRSNWKEISNATEHNLKRYISYLFAVEQIRNNGGRMDKDTESFSYYLPDPSRRVNIPFKEDMMEISFLLLNGLLKYRIVECPEDLEFNEDDVDRKDYTLITSAELFDKLKDLPDPDIIDEIDNYDIDYLNDYE